MSDVDLRMIMILDLQHVRRREKIHPIPIKEKSSKTLRPNNKKENDTLTAFGQTGRYTMRRPAKPHNSTWTPEREMKLRKMFYRGTAVRRIAEKFGISDAAIRQKLERMGLLYKPKEGPTPKELFVEELLKKKGIK